jgi:hypothetical protein
MNSKLLIALIPLLLLSLSAWRFSLPDLPAGAPPHAGGASASAPAPAAVLEYEVRESYAPFDMEHAFVRPAGPKGLEYRAETRHLEGKKVRVAGSMVRHLHDDAAVFLLTSQPMTLNMQEYGLADDLPPHAVHVILPVLPGMAPDWVRQPLVVYGTLELGSRTELDGRISHLRLAADHITAADGRTLIEPRRSILLQPSRIQSGKVKLETLSARSVE